jgi:catechol 2,3-dioxygenase-like lactoylglutathione lyase family enzyme
LSVELNHTIVHARDNRESAEFFAGLLGLEITAEWGPFIAVDLSNGVTLDFATIPADRITPQHYAFLISEEEFDTAYARIRQRGIEHYADPHRTQPGTINHNDGGCGVYFMDPAGHAMELITVPYGGRPA